MVVSHLLVAVVTHTPQSTVIISHTHEDNPYTIDNTPLRVYTCTVLVSPMHLGS